MSNFMTYAAAMALLSAQGLPPTTTDQLLDPSNVGAPAENEPWWARLRGSEFDLAQAFERTSFGEAGSSDIRSIFVSSEVLDVEVSDSGLAVRVEVELPTVEEERQNDGRIRAERCIRLDLQSGVVRELSEDERPVITRRKYASCDTTYLEFSHHNALLLRDALSHQLIGSVLGDHSPEPFFADRDRLVTFQRSESALQSYLWHGQSGAGLATLNGAWFSGPTARFHVRLGGVLDARTGTFVNQLQPGQSDTYYAVDVCDDMNTVAGPRVIDRQIQPHNWIVRDLSGNHTIQELELPAEWFDANFRYHAEFLTGCEFLVLFDVVGSFDVIWSLSEGRPLSFSLPARSTFPAVTVDAIDVGPGFADRGRLRGAERILSNERTAIFNYTRLYERDYASLVLGGSPFRFAGLGLTVVDLETGQILSVDAIAAVERIQRRRFDRQGCNYFAELSERENHRRCETDIDYLADAFFVPETDNIIACNYYSGDLSVWDARSGQLLAHYIDEREDGCEALFFDPQTRTVTSVARIGDGINIWVPA